MTIHSDHPFADPEDRVRRFRGRLGGAVSLLTSGGTEREWAGLTVSSLMVANGRPAQLLTLVDPEADLTERVEQTGRAVCQLLAASHQQLAESFAGQLPAPGGAFRLAAFRQTDHGPLLPDATAWTALSLEHARDLGWSRLLVLTVDEVWLGDGDTALEHRRGRYRTLGSAG